MGRSERPLWNWIRDIAVSVTKEQVLNLSLYSVIGGLVGARLWEVVFFNGSYYLENPAEIFAIWQGGMSIQGGLVGGILVAVWYMKKLGWKFWETADLFAPGMILGQAVGRVACFLNGDAYGAPTGSSFGIVYPPGTVAYDRYGDQPLWPAEIWEGQWNLIVFALEFLRGDSPQYMFGWTAAQWTSVGAVVATVILLWVTRKEVTKHAASA